LGSGACRTGSDTEGVGIFVRPAGGGGPHALGRRQEPPALKNICSTKTEDRTFVYHTSKEKAAIGVVEVVTEPYPAPESKNTKLVVVDVEARRRVGGPVTLAELKALPAFEGSPLVVQTRPPVARVASLRNGFFGSPFSRTATA
jgi:hypothetical protein